MIIRSFSIVGLLAAIMLSSVAHAQKNEQTLHMFIDRWHEAAARADANLFFGSMAENSTYIGTEDSERWTKPEFMKFAKPYFDRGSAWDFKPRERALHLSADGKIAWFSELLDTWMGVCRGSGVLVRQGKEWKIAQYHLSVTVPNDIIKEFIQLVDDYGKRQKK